MKVVFVSTYPPAPCGIGDYTRELRLAVERAMGQGPIPVIAERHPAVTSELDPAVVRAWERGTAWDRTALDAVLREKPDVVHIQHEEALLGQDGRLVRFLEALGKAGIARVVTLHSVYRGPWGIPTWWPPPLFHRAVAAQAEAIVVHQRGGGLDFLEAQGVPTRKIHVIPHGTLVMKTLSREAARDVLNLPREAQLALFVGVLHPKKNIPTIIAAAERVARRLPRFRLLVAGRPRERNLLDRIHTRQLFKRMRPGVEAGWLDVRRGFIPAEVLPAYFCAADVILFPYNQRYGSASGVFHLALAAGRATICSSSPKFGEAREIFSHRIAAGFAETQDVGAWVVAIEQMLTNQDMRQEAEALAEEGAKASAWSSLGKVYADLYRSVRAR